MDYCRCRQPAVQHSRSPLVSDEDHHGGRQVGNLGLAAINDDLTGTGEPLGGHVNGRSSVAP